NGRAFLLAADGLRGRIPVRVEWKGPDRQVGSEPIPADLRIDHVFLISIKTRSGRPDCSSYPTMRLISPGPSAKHWRTNCPLACGLSNCSPNTEPSLSQLLSKALGCRTLPYPVPP